MSGSAGGWTGAAAGRLWPLAAGLLLAVLVLAGCSGDPPRAGTLPPVRSASSTSASAALSPTPSPTPVKQQIRAAVYAYYAEVTRAAQTNDTSRLKTMTTDGCPCYGAVRSIDRAARAGRTTPEAAWRVRSVRIRDVVGLTGAALVRYTVSAYQVYNRAGAVIARYPEEQSYVALSFVQYQGRWVIGNVTNMKG